MPSKPEKLVRRPAAYTPGRPSVICPVCWSRPDLEWGKGRGTAVGHGRRGWGITHHPEPVVIAGETVPVAALVYRCANPACDTAIELLTRFAGGYLPHLLAAHQLREAAAEAFEAGRHAPGGVWLDRAGEPRTAPPQRDLFS